MIRSFNNWFDNLPKKIQIEAKKWQEKKPTIQTVNFIVITNIMAKREELNPTPAEIEEWLDTHQIERYVSEE